MSYEDMAAILVKKRAVHSDVAQKASMQDHQRTIDIAPGAWPDFPLPLSEGVGAQVGSMLYAGLGTAGLAWYGLDAALPNATWRRLADFPQRALSGAVAAAVNGRVYVFGGISAGDDGLTRQRDAIYCYEPESDRWQQLPGHLPVGLLGASALAVDSNTIWFFGGYNKPQFDDFHRAYESASPVEAEQINRAYMSRTIGEFRWNDHVWAYQVDRGEWLDLGGVPHWPNCKSGLISTPDSLFLVGGEVKPGLRALTVKQARRDHGSPFWLPEQDLPAIDAAGAQEGIAGAFTGLVGGIPVAAGGTHFPGAWRQYEEGQLFAHAGLRKTWRTEIYAEQQGTWRCVGQLPQARANGLAFQVGEGLLLVGGDTQDGQPCQNTLLLTATLQVTE